MFTLPLRAAMLLLAGVMLSLGLWFVYRAGAISCEVSHVSKNADAAAAAHNARVNQLLGDSNPDGLHKPDAFQRD